MGRQIRWYIGLFDLILISLLILMAQFIERCVFFVVAIACVFSLYVTGFHITRLPHTQNQTYDFTRNGLLV